MFTVLMISDAFLFSLIFLFVEDNERKCQCASVYLELAQWN